MLHVLLSSLLASKLESSTQTVVASIRTSLREFEAMLDMHETYGLDANEMEDRIIKFLRHLF